MILGRKVIIIIIMYEVLENEKKFLSNDYLTESEESFSITGTVFEKINTSKLLTSHNLLPLYFNLAQTLTYFFVKCSKSIDFYGK